MNHSLTARVRAVLTIAAGAVCISFATTSFAAGDLGQLEAQMRKATEDAKAKASSGQKSYSVQSASTFDAELREFVSLLNGVLTCAASHPQFQQQYSAQISQGKQMLGHAQQFQGNAMLKAFAGPASVVLQSALPVVRTLADTCKKSTGQSAAAGKYEKVSAVMKQVFSGGDLGPTSRAVKHAADVDMPARGGTPEALRAYLNSQNGTIKNWYRTNFGLR
ncbi:MAG: hypothetical protein V4731_10720 [Pseudomonadota bacterium]